MKKKTKRIIGTAVLTVLLIGCAASASKKETPVHYEPAARAEYAEEKKQTAAPAEKEVLPEEKPETEVKKEEKKEEPAKAEPAVEASQPADGIRPEFKEAVDAYVQFYEEYAAFMSRYANDPTNMSLLLEMASWSTKVADMEDKLDAFDEHEEDWSSQELAYFANATIRIEQLMLQALAAM